MNDCKQDLTGGAGCTKGRKPYEREAIKDNPLAGQNPNISFREAVEASTIKRKPYSSAPEMKDPLFMESTNIREAFQVNRDCAPKYITQAGSFAVFRSAIAGSLAGGVDAIEEELTTLNARKELLEEELYKYKAAADLMLKQMTNEQN
jgi:hypothetical protein